MKTRILKLIIIVWICFSLFIIIGSKNKEFGKKVLFIEKNTGDLYKKANLNFFKEKINYVTYNEKTSPEEAEIITAGDSFFKVTNESDSFANLLENKTKKNVYNLSKSNFSIIGNPIKLLKKEKYKKSGKKILILETIERGAYFYGLKYYTDELNIPIKSKFIRKKKLIFGDKKMRHLFTRNIFIHHINKFVKWIRFKILKEIDGGIGEYSMKQKMLFHQEGTKFYYEKKNKKVMKNAVKYILKLKEELKKKYDIEMVFMIIPDKFTIYKDFIENSQKYDDFIPLFQTRLEEAGIQCIDIYYSLIIILSVQLFRNKREIVFVLPKGGKMIFLLFLLYYLFSVNFISPIIDNVNSYNILPAIKFFLKRVIFLVFFFLIFISIKEIKSKFIKFYLSGFYISIIFHALYSYIVLYFWYFHQFDIHTKWLSFLGITNFKNKWISLGSCIFWTLGSSWTFFHYFKNR